MGVEHHGWYNPGSTWYGDARRVGSVLMTITNKVLVIITIFTKSSPLMIFDTQKVRQLARLTVALNKFGKTHMFGPGTPCRCSHMSSLNVFLRYKHTKKTEKNKCAWCVFQIQIHKYTNTQRRLRPRCASCVSPPTICRWGKGPYPGVVLLYMQVFHKLYF